MFELDCVNLNDNAKKKSYDNFMSFGLYSGILRNIRFRKNAQNILEMFNDKKK